MDLQVVFLNIKTKTLFLWYHLISKYSNQHFFIRKLGFLVRDGGSLTGDYKNQ